MSIMNATRPPNIYVMKEILRVNNSLNYDRVPAFEIITADRCCPVGNTMYLRSNIVTIAFAVECTMTHTVLHATPNKWPMVQYLEGVAKHHKVIATLLNTDRFAHHSVLTL